MVTAVTAADQVQTNMALESLLVVKGDNTQVHAHTHTNITETEKVWSCLVYLNVKVVDV